MLILDVGSTKRDVVDAARRVLRDHVGSFVPCHPVAGKEVAGVEHADPDLYSGRQLIVTPIDRTDPAKLQSAIELWEAIGCHVQRMTPESHDAAFAAVSHLPHLIAFALMQAITSQKEGKEFLELAGPGFRDFSRIAASDPKVWRDILLANRQELLEQSQIFRRTLQAMEVMMESGNGDGLEQLIEQASEARAHWRLASGLR